MKTRVWITGLAVVLLSASMSVQAGLLASSLTGDTVIYSDVSENVTGDGINGSLGTYGTPVISGDLLDFDPLGLGVNSSGGGLKQTDALLSFDIKAKDGFAISDLIFSELGDYLLAGAGGAGTYAQVSATFNISIVEIDGLAPIAPINHSEVHSFSNVALPADAGSGIVWSGSADLDFNAIITGAGQSYVDGATWVSIELANIMYAGSEAGTIAQIKKKDGNGFAVTSVVVPEPASVALFAGASSSIFFIRRRFTA